ncbi:tetratricopeptide repeat protein [Bradyrhizobium sp.]|jgi:TPR repeat protein|uniref:tetratricopeptide repeat protein n=1 Tax=Bradyrhizobium sp. TaxID=376 RepID=UPI003D13E755
MPRRHPVVQVVIIALTVLAGSPVIAGPLEDASAAARGGDYPAASRMFRALADQDNTYAQYNLGVMYAKGLGVTQDSAEAMKWLHLAAAKGLAIAQNDVGTMYRLGWGVARDDAEAVNWFRRAADQDFMVAQNNLGDMYAMGYGVQRDYSEALKWYRLAAEQDSPYAQNIIGIAYEHGFSVQQSDADALAWYRRAANKVYDSSHLTLMHGPQYNLAAMYAAGRGVSKNNVQAYMWFTLAAKLGDVKAPDLPGVAAFGSSKQTALEQRDTVAALMTSAEIAEGEKLAREWSPHPVVFIRPQAK